MYEHLSVECVLIADRHVFQRISVIIFLNLYLWPVHVLLKCLVNVGLRVKIFIFSFQWNTGLKRWEKACLNKMQLFNIAKIVSLFATFYGCGKWSENGCFFVKTKTKMYMVKSASNCYLCLIKSSVIQTNIIKPL